MAKREQKPDCGYAWIVVFACFVINFIMAGLARAAGVLYVALIDNYSVSREVATAPFSLRFCVRNLAGPLIGALGQRYGVRPVVLLGGLVCGVGGIICSVAPNVTWITVGWGGFHGLGYGLSNIIHVIVLQRYFIKYKGIALGISYTGDCFGTFMLPSLIEFLLSMYGFHGTFLVLAAISLNLVPAAMILIPPPWEINDENQKKESKENKENVPTEILNNHGIVNKCFDHESEADALSDRIEDSKFHFVRGSVLNQEEYSNTQNKCDLCSFAAYVSRNCNGNSKSGNEVISDTSIHDKFSKKCEHNSRNGELVSNQSSSLRLFEKTKKNGRWRFNFPIYNMKRKNSQISVLSCPPYIGKSTVESLCKSVVADQILVPGCYPQVPDESTENVMKNMRNNESTAHLETHSEKDICSAAKMNMMSSIENCDTIKSKCNDVYSNDIHEQSALKQFFRTNVKPIFLLISFNMGLYVFLFIAIFTIIIDYASDNGIPGEYGKFLIISFSVTDLFGRLGFGVVLDKKWLALSHYAGLTTGIMGLMVFIMPFYKNFLFWMISFSFCGFIQGGTAIMYPVLVEHYMKKREESIALGCLNLYGGLLLLPAPSMIGYFRDTVGSYDGVFWTTGGLCTFIGAVWLLEPYLISKKRNVKRTPEEDLKMDNHRTIDISSFKV